MGTLCIGLTGSTQYSLLQVENCARQNFQDRLIIVNQLVPLVVSKTMGSMNLEELLKNWTPETNQSTGIEASNGSTLKSLQHQGSLGISGNFSDKIADEVWREMERGEKIKGRGEVKKEPSIGEMTLEDFLTKEGAIDESALSPAMPLDMAAASQCFPHQMSLSPAPSIGTLSDTPASVRKRDRSVAYDGPVEKKLKRKIKNRESAARSRARKQAYHNELVNKVSRLEEQNMRLKKEKEFQNRFSGRLSDETRYQLRRTSSAVF